MQGNNRSNVSIAQWSSACASYLGNLGHAHDLPVVLVDTDNMAGVLAPGSWIASEPRLEPVGMDEEARRTSSGQ